MAQVQRVDFGVLGMGNRSLQNGQVKLQAVVCHQRGPDPGGEQQGARPHRGDSVRLLHRSLFSSKMQLSLGRPRDGFAANARALAIA
jgi:hypothetical protein